MAKKTKAADLSIEEKLEQALIVPGYEPYKIPDNWCWTNLKTVCNLDNGIKHNNESLVYFDAKTLREITEPVSRNSGVIVEKGQKVILVDGENSGEVFVIPDRGYMGSTFRILNISKQFDEMYIRYFIDIFREELKKNKIGSAIPHHNKELFYGLQFPLPPLPEQHRIVERIESLFSKLDEAKEKAQEVIDSFETRKAAILHKAFTGELTAKWREENGVGFDSWEKYSFGDIITGIEAGKNRKAEERPPEKHEFGIVKVSAVTWGEFDENESKTCLADDQWNEKVQIKPNDFLFSRANTIQLVGNCVIVNAVSKRLMLSDKILRLSFNQNITPKYILYFTRSQLYRKQVEILASGNQESMRNISQKNMKLIIFSKPKQDEQNEIVRILDDIFDKENKEKEAAETVIDQIDTMKKAILSRAFRGELGTNDPEEESAVELLKEILLGNNNEEKAQKPKRTRIVIPKEIDSLLKTELERKIIKLFLKSDTGEVTAEEIMAVSSKKFDLIDAINSLKEKKLIEQLNNNLFILLR